MSDFPYRVPPSADRATRQSALLEIRRLIASGNYHVPADQVAAAFLADAGLIEPDSSSCGGQDADGS
ncbi:MAG: hypothetical protein ACXW15_07305 [Acidimicrobiia bacterium]